MFLRNLLTGFALILVLNCCGTPATAPTQLASDVNLVASGLTTVLVDVQQIPNVPPATIVKLQGYLTTIKADAALVAQQTANPPTSVIQEYTQGVQSLAAVALPLVPGGAVWTPIVQAALSLLPTILAAADISGVALAKSTYDPDAARVILLKASVAK